MKKFPLALLLAVPLAASPQGLTPNAPGQSGGKVLWSAPFATPGCYASGQTAGASSAISITRTTSATYIDGNGALQTCASGEFRVAPDGLVVEPLRENTVKQSNTMSSGTSAVSPWTLSNATVATVAGSGPAGTGTWAEFTTTGTSSQIYQTASTTSATVFAASVWMAKATGTGSAGLYFQCGAAPSGCTCSRSDGGACTTGNLANANNCSGAVSDLGTTPVRLTVIVTCPSAVVGGYFSLLPGAYSVHPSTTRYTGAQLEVGSSATSLIQTTSTTPIQRGADQVTATAPAGTTFWSYTLNGTLTGSSASPGTITFVAGSTKKVKVCGKAKKLGDCR